MDVYQSAGFYYDALVVRGDSDQYVSAALRSLVGILALFPVAAIDLERLASGGCADHELARRIRWFEQTHADLVDQADVTRDGDSMHLLSFVEPDRLRRILSRVLDEAESLGPHGIRGISRACADSPYSLDLDGARLAVGYEPAESSVGLGRGRVGPAATTTWARACRPARRSTGCWR